jgi:RNA polymerase sigma-70 factor, ECF subfamily
MSSLITARLSVLPLVGRGKGQAESVEPEGVRATDEDLLARISNGEQQALEFLFERYARVIRAVAARILRDSSEAEDLVQELFLFIQRKCALFDSSKSTARSWIIQMAYCRAFERRRYLTARRFYSRTDIESNSHRLVGTSTRECDYSAEAVFGRNGLNQVFRSLSQDQRETLRLHFFEGYTFAEISQKLGQSFGNVRNHYYRGLDKLRRQMIKNSVRAGQSNGE